MYPSKKYQFWAVFLRAWNSDTKPPPGNLYKFPKQELNGGIENMIVIEYQFPWEFE